MAQINILGKDVEGVSDQIHEKWNVSRFPFVVQINQVKADVENGVSWVVWLGAKPAVIVAHGANDDIASAITEIETLTRDLVAEMSWYSA